VTSSTGPWPCGPCWPPTPVDSLVDVGGASSFADASRALFGLEPIMDLV
jgi:hypothetical protein